MDGMIMVNVVVLNLWYVYHWWYLSIPQLVLRRSLSPFIVPLSWYLERKIISEVVLGVKRLRTTGLESSQECKSELPSS